MSSIGWQEFLDYMHDEDEDGELCAAELAISWRYADAHYVRQWLDPGETPWP